MIQASSQRAQFYIGSIPSFCQHTIQVIQAIQVTSWLWLNNNVPTSFIQEALSDKRSKISTQSVSCLHEDDVLSACFLGFLFDLESFSSPTCAVISPFSPVLAGDRWWDVLNTETNICLVISDGLNPDCHDNVYKYIDICIFSSSSTAQRC